MRERNSGNERRRVGGIGALVLGAIALLAGCGGGNTVVVGSKDFSENIILGEIFSQMIEKNTSLRVTRKLNLGGTFVCFESLRKGNIDIYPEYTGTGLTAQLKRDVIADPDETYRVVKAEFAKRFDIAWLSPLGLNNTYAIAVTDAAARKYDLSTCSDLSAAAPALVFGAEHEFFNRQDGFDNFSQVYGLTFKNLAKMNVSLKYQAIGDGQIDATDVFSTDSQIKKYKLVILKDDKGFFPPYYAAPIVRNAVLKKHPEVSEVLGKLGGQISDADMTEMNYQVDEEKKPVAEVASAFLKSRGLIE